MMEESNKKKHFTVMVDLNVVQKKSRVVTYLFSAYFIPVYVSFIIVTNCGFVMRFVILAIYFRLKTTVFNVKHKNLMSLKKTNLVRYYYFLIIGCINL